jgi:Na+/H+-dicarboxylate symporter
VVWKMTPICLFWCSWREITNRSFKDLESTFKEILSLFYLTLYFWITAYVHLLSFIFADFLARFSLSN